MTIDYSQISEHSSYPIEQELHKMAYFHWLNAGCPEGRDLEFWCEAEREMFGYTQSEYWQAMDDMNEHNYYDDGSLGGYETSDVFKEYQFNEFWDKVAAYEQEIDS